MIPFLGASSSCFFAPRNTRPWLSRASRQSSLWQHSLAARYFSFLKSTPVKRLDARTAQNYSPASQQGFSPYIFVFVLGAAGGGYAYVQYPLFRQRCDAWITKATELSNNWVRWGCSALNAPATGGNPTVFVPQQDDTTRRGDYDETRLSPIAAESPTVKSTPADDDANVEYIAESSVDTPRHNFLLFDNKDDGRINYVPVSSSLDSEQHTPIKCEPLLTKAVSAIDLESSDVLDETASHEPIVSSPVVDPLVEDSSMTAAKQHNSLDVTFEDAEEAATEASNAHVQREDVNLAQTIEELKKDLGTQCPSSEFVLSLIQRLLEENHRFREQELRRSWVEEMDRAVNQGVADALCKAEIEAEKRLEELRAEMSKERRSMAASFASTLGKAVALEEASDMVTRSMFDVMKSNEQLWKLVLLHNQWNSSRLTISSFLSSIGKDYQEDAFVTAVIESIPDTLSQAESQASAVILAPHVLETHLQSVYTDALQACFIAPEGGLLQHLSAGLRKYIYEKTGWVMPTQPFKRYRWNNKDTKVIRRNISLLEQATAYAKSGDLYASYSRLSESTGLLRILCDGWLQAAEKSLTFESVLQVIVSHVIENGKKHEAVAV